MYNCSNIFTDGKSTSYVFSCNYNKQPANISYEAIKVLLYTKWSWPSEKHYEYMMSQLKISCVNYLLWGGMPQRLREQLLKELYHDHSGMPRMKYTSRSYIRYPGLNWEIEQLVRECSYQSVKNAQHDAILQPWTWPAKPWKRMYPDFTAPHSNDSFIAMHIQTGCRYIIKIYLRNKECLNKLQHI